MEGDEVKGVVTSARLAEADRVMEEIEKTGTVSCGVCGKEAPDLACQPGIAALRWVGDKLAGECCSPPGRLRDLRTVN